MESESAEHIISSFEHLNYKDRIHNLCGKILLNELKQIFTNGGLFIGCDSGPMHIASMAGIPIVALMGPQTPQLFGPWGLQKKTIIYKNYYCSPCWQSSCLHTKSGAGACIMEIQPKEVFDEAILILNNNY